MKTNKKFLTVLVSTLVMGFLFYNPSPGISGKSVNYMEALWGHLKTLCSYGPRNPGSKGHDKARRYIKQVGMMFADEVLEQKFAYQPINRKPVAMYNIEFRFKGQRGGRPILLGAHYDTRPFADEEKNSALRHEPILGANDGGSGTAVLLGLAQYLRDHKPKRPVRLVFFDGEDFGAKNTSEYFIGSKYYAGKLESQEKSLWPSHVLIVDMVGDKDLEIFKETYSVENARGLLDIIYRVAKRKSVSQIKPEVKYKIRDDHLPFIHLGIPSAVLIDFDYPYWHTHQDTLDKCSPESMYAVFSVVAEVLDEI